jgi:hypothetical protein
MSSDDRVGETTRFTYRPSTEWYWFPQQKPNEVSMLKCYDSVQRSLACETFHTSGQFFATLNRRLAFNSRNT